MYQIYRQLHRPQDHEFHRHKQLLEDIVQLVTESAQAVQLYKVKSHIGMVGNEIADELAKAATQPFMPAEGSISQDANLPQRRFLQGSNRNDLHWPVLRELQPARDPGEPDKVVLTPLLNLGPHLKRVCKAACGLGSANTETMYFSSWKRLERDMDVSSYHMMHSAAVTKAEQATALKYRTGTMFTAKLRYRFKMADSSRCLGCGAEDGGHHTASGCAALQRLYIHRHNKAGQLIMAAVQQGRRGSEVVMMDLGAAGGPQGAPTEEQLATALPHRIPAEALPPGMPAAVKAAVTRNSIPDALLYNPAQGGEPAKYAIVEIKYCRDTDPEGRLAAARAQHRQLAEAIARADPAAQVEYVPILLGVSGAIYKSDTLDRLQTLGVRRGLLDKLKYKLHVHAVKQLHWIYTVKRRHEQAGQGGRGPRNAAAKRGRSMGDTMTARKRQRVHVGPRKRQRTNKGHGRAKRHRS
jgi:hypothetical protein